ncbi:MFS transporter [Streptomyces solicathayae]|uniref:MFS transporter n=1 Tax=Streptomyces solicathayae TaxID=3081768 RepID=A0ABZ0LQM3_9ACTN|nr:MFS transporter [Streptomyces sp. HUAS YS2]WOX21600.1 MFS transporter [Streptomyces sp. HUAS YS2]
MTEINESTGLAGESRAGKAPQKRALIGIGALLVILTNAVLFILPPLLPIIQAQYGLTTVSATMWIFTALTLGGGAGYILLPRLADVYGDRNASVFASACLTVGAFVPAVGDSYPALLIGSTIMGFGSAAQMLPLGFLRRNLAEHGITTAVEVLVIATGVGIVVGMIGGGLLVQDLSLRSFFWILTAAFAATTIASFALVPHSPPAQSSGRVGALGTVWMIAWVAAVLLTLTQGLVWGGAAVAPLLAGVVGAALWVRVERRSSAPVFDAALLKAPSVTVASLSIALFGAVNAAFLLLLSTYSQVVPAYLPPEEAYGLGRTALQTGLLMVPFAVMFVVGGKVVRGPIEKGRGTAVLVNGALISAAGLAWLALAHDHPWHYLVGAGVIGLGCSMGYTAGFSIAQMAVPEEKAGMAAGVAGTAMAIGIAFGSALVTGVLSASVVPVPGTDIEVAEESLYGTGYWISVGLAALIVVAVLISRARNGRRVPATAS